MAKIHTRLKRKLSSGYLPNKKKGAKTFTTEAAANVYAKKEGIKKFSLENLAENKLNQNKFRIITEE